jgi:hypothetical protein
MANEKLSATISSKTREVSLCAGTVEGLTFLVWRYLVHYLLYTTAATPPAQSPSSSKYSAVITLLFRKLGEQGPLIGRLLLR